MGFLEWEQVQSEARTVRVEGGPGHTELCPLAWPHVQRLLVAVLENSSERCFR